MLCRMWGLGEEGRGREESKGRFLFSWVKMLIFICFFGSGSFIIMIDCGVLLVWFSVK